MSEDQDEPGIAPDMPDAHQLLVQTHLSHQSRLLSGLIAQARVQLGQLAVTDDQPQELVMENSPVVGARRVIVPRIGNGVDQLVVPVSTPAAPFQNVILPANPGRIGGLISSYGTAAVVLYLTDQPVPYAGVPAIAITQTGTRTWNFLLGNTLWCGNVSAVALGGVGAIAVAEI